MIGDSLHTRARFSVARFTPEYAAITVSGVAALAGGEAVGLQMRSAFPEPVGDPIYRFGGWLNRERRRRWRRFGFAQLPTNLIAQRQ